MIYFTSDLHFYHEKVINFANRPFDNADEMNRVLIDNWNRTVSAKDEVYILGDVTMKGPEYATEVLSQLRGKKYLIKGNHDTFADKKTFDRTIFEWVKDYHEFSYQNTRFVLFHYPIEEWSGYFRGAVHLHGHQHNHEDYNIKNREKGLLRFDVGVDANHMAPVGIKDIISFFSMSEM